MRCQKWNGDLNQTRGGGLTQKLNNPQFKLWLLGNAFA